jgi:hypothetical protein
MADEEAKPLENEEKGNEEKDMEEEIAQNQKEVKSGRCDCLLGLCRRKVPIALFEISILFHFDIFL